MNTVYFVITPVHLSTMDGRKRRWSRRVLDLRGVLWLSLSKCSHHKVQCEKTRVIYDSGPQKWRTHGKPNEEKEDQDVWTPKRATYCSSHYYRVIHEEKWLLIFHFPSNFQVAMILAGYSNWCILNVSFYLVCSPKCRLIMSPSENFIPSLTYFWNSNLSMKTSKRKKGEMAGRCHRFLSAYCLPLNLMGTKSRPTNNPHNSSPLSNLLLKKQLQSQTSKRDFPG